MDDQTLADLLCADLIEGGVVLGLFPKHRKVIRIERLAQLMEVGDLWRLRMFVKDSDEKAAYERGFAARQPTPIEIAALDPPNRPGLLRRWMDRIARIITGIC
jgi:hypothetical protein